MIKILSFIFISITILSCSFNSGGGFWTQEKEIKNNEGEFKSIFVNKTIETKELNKNFNVLVNKSSFQVDSLSNLNNNDGYNSFRSGLNKITKYNFSKIKNYHLFDPNLILFKENVIFFDNKGTILNFNNDAKLIWKQNNYSKEEKNSAPLISLKNTNNRLIVADNFAKIYVLDINNGEILWSKKNKTSFNSEIKIYKDKVFVVDASNNLICFSLIDGKKIWSYTTNKSFVNSFKKLSIIVKNNRVVFTNSIGEITAINVDNGSLLWQHSTQSTKIFEDIMNLKTSKIIENDNSIYFSNNKNQFFSIDLISGAVNWTQEINSDLKPSAVKNFLFTISLDGYFFVIDKKNGNILKIIDIFSQTKLNKKGNVIPTGFILNNEEIFITTNIGRLIIVDIKSGKIKKILKIDKKKISRPFVKDQSMYLIKDNSIVKLN